MARARAALASFSNAGGGGCGSLPSGEDPSIDCEIPLGDGLQITQSEVPGRLAVIATAEPLIGADCRLVDIAPTRRPMMGRAIGLPAIVEVDGFVDESQAAVGKQKMTAARMHAGKG